MSIHKLSLSALQQKLTNKEIGTTELAKYYLSRIDKLDGNINSFITVDKSSVLAEAENAQQLVGKFPLAGIPVAYKDNLCTHNLKMTCASKMLDNFIAPYDATLVTNAKAQGLVTLGKTNMDEFAFGSSSENSYFGAVKNPWNLEKVPGGSSGGSAASVSAGLTPMAIGSDTGGSIRQPAAFCGITGLKPTYGMVSRYGLTAFASSLDQAGPMAKSAEDIALIMDAIAGYDKKDSTSSNITKPNFHASLKQSIEGLKIGLVSEFFQGLNNAIAEKIINLYRWYEKQGAKLIDINLQHLPLAIPCYYIIAPAEASSNLSRFDGVRYGHRSERAKSLNELYQLSRAEGFGMEVKRRVLAGTYTLSHGYYDAYFIKAQKIRRLIANDFSNAFEEVDVIISPTTPTTAFNIGEKKLIDSYLADIYTSCANLAGLPALSMPAGFIDSMPIGAQLIGPHFSDAKLIGLCHQYQLAHDEHLVQPPLFSE